MKYLNAPQFKQMADIIDPINYLDRYADKAKYVICATGDEFFLPDGTSNAFSLLGNQTKSYICRCQLLLGQIARQQIFAHRSQCRARTFGLTNRRCIVDLKLPSHATR